MPLSDLIRKNVIMVDPASGMERTAIAVKLTEVVGTGGTQRMELEGKTETVAAGSRGYGNAGTGEVLA